MSNLTASIPIKFLVLLVFGISLAGGQVVSIKNESADQASIDSSIVRVEQMQKVMAREAELRGIALEMKSLKFLDTASSFTPSEKIMLKELYFYFNPKGKYKVTK